MFRTGFVVEGREADQHLHVDLAAAVNEQPEVFGCEVLQSILRKHVQEALSHSLGRGFEIGLEFSNYIISNKLSIDLTNAFSLVNDTRTKALLRANKKHRDDEIL